MTKKNGVFSARYVPTPPPLLKFSYNAAPRTFLILFSQKKNDLVKSDQRETLWKNLATRIEERAGEILAARFFQSFPKGLSLV